MFFASHPLGCMCFHILPFCLLCPLYRGYITDFCYPNSCIQSVRVACSCFTTSRLEYNVQGIFATQCEVGNTNLSNIKNFNHSNNTSIVLRLFLLPLSLPAIAYNVPAAWRRRGFHCRSGGNETFKSPQTFGRATAPLAPNRPLHAGIFFIIHFNVAIHYPSYNNSYGFLKLFSNKRTIVTLAKNFYRLARIFER